MLKQRECGSRGTGTSSAKRCQDRDAQGREQEAFSAQSPSFETLLRLAVSYLKRPPASPSVGGESHWRREELKDASGNRSS